MRNFGWVNGDVVGLTVWLIAGDFILMVELHPHGGRHHLRLCFTGGKNVLGSAHFYGMLVKVYMVGDFVIYFLSRQQEC